MLLPPSNIYRVLLPLLGLQVIYRYRQALLAGVIPQHSLTGFTCVSCRGSALPRGFEFSKEEVVLLIMLRQYIANRAVAKGISLVVEKVLDVESEGRASRATVKRAID